MCGFLEGRHFSHNGKNMKIIPVSSHLQKTDHSVLAQPELPNSSQPINPAAAYILSLQSASSKKTMKSFLNRIAVLLGYENLMQVRWHELRRHHVQAIIAKLSEQDLSPATVNTYLSAMKGVALEAWASGLMSSNDHAMIKQVKSLRGKRVRKGKALSKENVQKLLNINKNNPIGVRNFAIFGLMVGCGLRRAEVVTINVGDLDQEEGRLIVRGKGDKERVLYVPKGVIASIQHWLKVARLGDDKPMFTRILRYNIITTKRLTSQAIYFLIKQQQEKLALPDISPHDLRRTFATMLLERGEDLITVKEAMGHSSVDTTQTYDMRGEEKLKQTTTHFDWL